MTIQGLEGLRAIVGTELGPSDWQVVEQESVDTFAELSGDDQWIHVDPDRAAAGPFGATVAHGLLTLSALPKLVGELRRVEGLRMGLNYGYDRVRFPSPLPVGSRIRGRVTVTDVEDTADGGVQVRTHVVVEVEGRDKPCLVADMLSRQYY